MHYTTKEKIYGLITLKLCANLICFVVIEYVNVYKNTLMADMWALTKTSLNPTNQVQTSI